MRLIENTAALQANLLSGDIDLASGLTIDQAIDLQQKHADRFDVAFLPSLTTNFLYLKLENPILADKRVRQAILLAIDRRSIVDRLYGGKAAVANSILSPIEASYDAKVKQWPYDPARARALLAEAGYTKGADGILVAADGTRLSLDLLVSSGIRINELLQQVLQSQLRQVGIDIVAREEPVRVLLGETARKRLFSGMMMFSWTPGPDAVPYFNYDSARIPKQGNAFGGGNYTGYSNPGMDTMLTEAMEQLDLGKRQALWNEIRRRSCRTCRRSRCITG